MTLTLALALAAFTSADGTAGPLQAVAPTVDLGTLPSGPPCSHTFEIKNSGASTLRITGVAAGCGCSKAELSAKQLRAGESAKLTLVTSTLTQPEGAVSWPVTLTYTGDRDGTLELKLTAKLERAVSVTPPVVTMSTAGAVTHTLKVEDRRAKPLTVSKAESTSPSVTAEVRAATTADGKRVQEIVVSIKDELAVGSHADTVTLRTDDPNCPVLEIPVRVHKRAADGVTVTPASASVRFATGQAEASALVQLRGGGKSVAIKSVECSTPGVTVKFSEDAGPVATVRVIVSSAKAGASGTADVTVTLSEPTTTKLVIPVAWYAP